MKIEVPNWYWKEKKMIKDWDSIEVEEDRIALIQKIEGEGKRVVVPDDYTLQLDIDTEEEWERFKENSLLFFRILPIENTKIEFSFSGLPHRHITIRCKEPMTIWQRVALQMALGSHLSREVLNAYRVLVKVDWPILFFEKEEK